MSRRLPTALLTASGRRWFADVPFALVAWLVMLAACWQVLSPARAALTQWNAHTLPSWIGALPGTEQAEEPGARVCDLDTRLIHDGLLSAPRFRDTLRWWTGTWVGQVPFYRPLTSWLFWGEWKLFGDHEARYTLVGIGVYLGAAWQFGRFARALLEHYHCPRPGWATLLAAWLFLDSQGLIPSQQDANAEILGYWKNQPDPLCGIFAFQFCICYLKWMRGPSGSASPAWRTPPRSSRPQPQVFPPRLRPLRHVYARLRQWEMEHRGYSAMSFLLLACACKEAAILLPLLAVWLEAPSLLNTDRAIRRAALRRLAPVLSVLPLFLLWRAHCLQMLSGFHYGSNGSWPLHFADSIGGLISNKILRDAWDELLPGLTLYGMALLLRRRIALKGGWTRIGLGEWLGWGMGALICMDALGLLAARGENAVAQDPVVVLLRYATPYNMVNALLVFIFLGSIHHLAWRRYALGVFAYSWALLMLIPTLFSPPMPHRYYLMDAGYALLIGAGMACWSSRSQSPSATPAGIVDASHRQNS